MSVIHFCEAPHVQKPKKKKSESVPTESNGTEAKPKKTKSKKNGELTAESPAIQSKAIGLYGYTWVHY